MSRTKVLLSVARDFAEAISKHIDALQEMSKTEENVKVALALEHDDFRHACQDAMRAAADVDATLITLGEVAVRYTTAYKSTT